MCPPEGEGRMKLPGESPQKEKGWASWGRLRVPSNMQFGMYLHQKPSCLSEIYRLTGHPIFYFVSLNPVYYDYSFSVSLEGFKR